MSQETYWKFYVEKAVPDLPVILPKLIRFLGVSRAVTGLRYESKNRDPDNDESFSDVKPAKLAAMFDRKHNLHLDWGPALRSRNFANALEKELSADILGEHRPTEAGITVGPHKIYQLDHDWEPKLVGKSHLSVFCWGYYMPIDQPRFEAALPGLKCVAQFRREVESLLKMPVKFAVWEDF